MYIMIINSKICIPLLLSLIMILVFYLKCLKQSPDDNFLLKSLMRKLKNKCSLSKINIYLVMVGREVIAPVSQKPEYVSDYWVTARGFLFLS